MTTKKRKALRDEDELPELIDLDRRSWQACLYILVGILAIALGVWKLQNALTTAMDQRLDLEDRLEQLSEKPTSSASEPPKT